MPFYSIIIPTYNSAKTIKRCLQSVISQNWTNYEIIIQDGGSIDATEEIVQEFNDDRIVFHSKKDLGVYDAMNKALERINGEWVLFLGSDDTIYSDDVLENVFFYLSNTKMKFIYGDVIMKENILDEKGIKYRGDTSDSCLLQCNICHQAIFYHESIFSRFKYNIEYMVYADFDLNLKIAAEYERLYIPIIISNFQLGGISSVQNDPKFETDKWNNIVDYFSNKLKDQNFRIYKNEIKKVAFKKLETGLIKEFFNVIKVYFVLKFKL